jgi:hypothetical protein
MIGELDLTRATLQGEFHGPLPVLYRFGGLIMTITSLKSSQKATATSEVLASLDVRTLIANQLGVDVKRVTDEAHFTDDLGADWLDRLELMIVIRRSVRGRRNQRRGYRPARSRR